MLLSYLLLIGGLLFVFCLLLDFFGLAKYDSPIFM